jgi:hypothetical protein
MAKKNPQRRWVARPWRGAMSRRKAGLCHSGWITATRRRVNTSGRLDERLRPLGLKGVPCEENQP